MSFKATNVNKYYPAFMGLVPISCNLICRDSCCGETFENPAFTITKLKISEDVASNTHLFNQAMFGILIDEFEKSSALSLVNSTTLFLNGAIACEPPTAYASNPIKSIQIKLKSDFLSIHGTDTIFKDTDITNEFLVSNYAGNTTLNDIYYYLPYDFYEYRGLNFYLQLPDYRKLVASIDIAIILEDEQRFTFENVVISNQ